MYKFNYDILEYPFEDIVSDWLETDDLSKLHEFKQYKLFKRINDQSSMWHKMFYNQIRIDSRFNDIYMRFLTEYIKPKFNNDDIAYQKIPTFRVHLLGNISVGEFHKDKYYRDESWAKKVQELNYFLPLTRAYGTNTIWTETEEDLGDYKEIRADYGECVEWSASNLTHGNKINRTSQTRVSIDFRVIPMSRYVGSDHLTINVNMPFKVGGYYEVI
jgi:hypothetical protein|tara:strand:- start:383 stop:1030 length:648 start_codon:yes stop_codon:yes gene_type:complete